MCIHEKFMLFWDRVSDFYKMNYFLMLLKVVTFAKLKLKYSLTYFSVIQNYIFETLSCKNLYYTEKPEFTIFAKLRFNSGKSVYW